MRGELLIRPSFNDHEVIADLLAPGGASIMVGRHRPIITRLVVDAHIAARRAQFADAAANAGIPLFIDPLTPLLQGELREDDPWAKLSFGTSDEVTPTDFSDSRNFVAAVCSFQLENGATAVIPPYPYVSEPSDPWFDLALRWLAEARSFIDREGVALPLVPVLCAQLQRLGSERTWDIGLDRFAATAIDQGAQAIALCLSPAGGGKDSYNKVVRLFRAAMHLADRSALPIYAWRQGIYGPALVAAGLEGYETGIGTSEQSNIRSGIAARRPPSANRERRGGGAGGIYLEPLGRSVNRRAAQLLLANVSMRAKLMCNDERCCPHGITSTIDHAREHAVRSRARELDTLAALPARSWRLNHLATKAQGAVTLAHQANRLLQEVGDEYRLGEAGFASLQRVCEELRLADSERRVVA